MIKIENTEVHGWRAAIRGMRNAFESWNKSDSFDLPPDDEGNPWIGPNDLKLMRKLAQAGPDHGKFLRMIDVTFDLTAPLYYLKQFDAYKVGITTNSESSMHSIHKKEFTLDDFSHEHLINEYGVDDEDWKSEWLEDLYVTIERLNCARRVFLDTNDRKYWWQLIQLLPSSYNQKRTVHANYQVLMNMYHARKNHRLNEWGEFCVWCESLPYFKEICLG